MFCNQFWTWEISSIALKRKEKDQIHSSMHCFCWSQKNRLFLKACFFFRRYHGARHISKLLCVIHKLFYVLRKKFTENSLEMCQITQCFLLKGFFKQNFNRNIRKCGKSESTKNLFSTFWVSTEKKQWKMFFFEFSYFLALCETKTVCSLCGDVFSPFRITYLVPHYIPPSPHLSTL